jgi:hypothetical protein
VRPVTLFDARAPGSDATLSDCGTYRYRLIRWWGDPNRVPQAHFVMLNPSTADASVDDPTIRRCIGFAKAWGFSGLIVTNLYALRATDPKQLGRHPDPVGAMNNNHLRLAAQDAGITVAAWGASYPKPHGKWRALEVQHILVGIGPVHTLGLTKNLDPRHPLYIRADTQPVPLETGP